ncbi:hypothetical protein GDO78_006814 [Eleutherodactylus coqui]|uniref:Uncharacterized protein n=1 Tax=Eleutherodactylus coqui TaxID=57060 RepID=A0A8J6KCH4_ELECQ|nr:hypothetical protein GDO78_006814 [Eleutherodactylus coqui]
MCFLCLFPPNVVYPVKTIVALKVRYEEVLMKLKTLGVLRKSLGTKVMPSQSRCAAACGSWPCNAHYTSLGRSAIFSAAVFPLLCLRPLVMPLYSRP